jgi:hypothetical protein
MCRHKYTSFHNAASLGRFAFLELQSTHSFFKDAVNMEYREKMESTSFQA